MYCWCEGSNSKVTWESTGILLLRHCHHHQYRHQPFERIRWIRTTFSTKTFVEKSLVAQQMPRLLQCPFFFWHFQFFFLPSPTVLLAAQTERRPVFFSGLPIIYFIVVHRKGTTYPASQLRKHGVSVNQRLDSTLFCFQLFLLHQTS